MNCFTRFFVANPVRQFSGFLSTAGRSAVTLAVLAVLAGTCSAAQAQVAAASNALPARPALKAEIIDLKALNYDDMGQPQAGHGSVRSKTLVSTPNGTISVQIGEAPKHTHQQSVEVQYVISGSGTFWLGDKPHRVHPGDLIIVPENTPHAGSHANQGHFKTISIKLPPPVDGDSQWLK